jgi:predicted dehydrogenase
MMEVGIRSPRWQRTVTLMCANGAAILEDAYADHILIVDNPRPNGSGAEARTTRRPISVEMPLLAELAAFLDHLRGGPPPRSSAAEAAQSVETIAAIRRLAGI